MGAFLTSRNVSDVLQGLDGGVVISLVSLSLVMIWRSTHVLNFAQGAIATFAAYCGMELLTYHVGFWWCALLSIVVGMAIGGVTERVLVRPLYGKSEINPIVVMVGFLFLLEGLAGMLWSTNTRPVPLPFSFVDWQIGGRPVRLSPENVFQISAAVVVATAVALLFRFTKIGLQLRASALAPEVARLLGVRVSRMLTLGWVLSAGVGAVAAVILASAGGYGSGLTPTIMDLPFVLGFIAAVIGGLESPWGAVVIGIAYGMLQQFVTDYLNANDVYLYALGLLVVVLMVRPSGLLSRQVVRRV